MSELFDQLKELFRQTEEPKEGFQPESLYVINRFLSMVPESFLLATRVNPYIGRLPGWMIYKLMWLTLPQQTRAPYFDYIKRPVLDETDEDVLKKLMRAFALNRETAEQFLTIFRIRDIDVEGAFGLESKKPKKEKPKDGANENHGLFGKRQKPRRGRSKAVPKAKGRGKGQGGSPLSRRSPFKTR